MIFQGYDPPLGDESKMGWKKSRLTKWSTSLQKAMKFAFYMQILGGLALSPLTIFILILEETSNIDLCFEGRYFSSSNWTSDPSKTQAVFVTVSSIRAFSSTSFHIYFHFLIFYSFATDSSCKFMKFTAICGVFCITWFIYKDCACQQLTNRQRDSNEKPSHPRKTRKPRGSLC